MTGWEVHASSRSYDYVICDDPYIDPQNREISCPGTTLPETAGWEKGSMIVGMGHLVFSALMIGAFVQHKRTKRGEEEFFGPNDMKLCLGWAIISWLLMSGMVLEDFWHWLKFKYLPVSWL